MSTKLHGFHRKTGRVLVPSLQNDATGKLDHEGKKIEAAKGRFRCVNVLSGLNRSYYLYKSSKSSSERAVEARERSKGPSDCSIDSSSEFRRLSAVISC